MALRGGGQSLMTFWNSEKLSNWNFMNCQWIVYSYTKSVYSPCPATAHMCKWTLWENDPSLAPKKNKKQNKKNASDKKTEIRNIKL